MVILCAGGISFYSNLYGWALDNIRAFEVVLANGTIVTASKSAHPDLYTALRGGGGNFGIVTSFTLDAYPHTGMWGGPVAWEFSQGEAVLTAFLNAGARAHEDLKASFILAMTRHDGQWFWGSWLSYCDAVPDPPPFAEILAVPAVINTTKLLNHSQMSVGMAEGFPPHIENSLWVACTKVDRRILEFWTETWAAEMNQIADVKGLKAQVAIQYITQNVTDRMSRNGGNALGLAGKGPFLMFNAEPAWLENSDSPRVFAALQTIFDKTKAEAERLNLHHPYIYLNYASQYQDAFGAFDRETKEVLIAVSNKYDPDGVFQHLRGAGFKLNGPPEAPLYS